MTDRAPWNLPGKPLIDKHTRYEDDYACRLFVHMNPRGQTLAVVGEALGVSRERVRQIEERALRKLQKRLDPEALAALLGESPLFEAVAHGAGRRSM